MTRHHKIAGIALVGFGLLIGGLGSAPSEVEVVLVRDVQPYCETDLEKVFELCDPDEVGGWKGCAFAQERLKDACIAGCVRYTCRAQVPCTGLDPMWCASCTDPRGAEFWALSLEATDPCWDLFAIQHDSFAYQACANKEFKALCPKWNGKHVRGAQDVEFFGEDELGPLE